MSESENKEQSTGNKSDVRKKRSPDVDGAVEGVGKIIEGIASLIPD